MTRPLEFDDDASRRVERMLATPDGIAQRATVLKCLDLREGQQVLDIGVGTGLLAYEVAKVVGPNGRVFGIDVSKSMIVAARARCDGMPWVECQVGDATRLPYPDGCFDATVSTQVLEYIPDVGKALAEAYRVLRYGGRLVVLDTDWASLIWNSGHKRLMEKVLSLDASHLANAHLPRTLTRRLRAAGFELESRSVHTILNCDYDQNTYSYGLIDMIASTLPVGRHITQEEVDDWADDLHRTGQSGDYFFSLNRYLFVAMKR